MSEHTCRKCGETKPAEEMALRKGKPSRVCLGCRGTPKVTAKKKPKTLADVVAKRVRKSKAPPPVALNGHLEVEQTYGFRAAWEDGFLAIEQDQVGEEGEAVTARLLLSKSDVARIAEWVRS